MSQPPRALPFFLRAGQGELFCMYYPPDPALPSRGAVLYVHPFAEELNKTRRMAALQARAFAASGYAVLQPDLYGCGDSSADFADARWQTWKQDLAHAAGWLEKKTGAALSVWGLRLGALLALEFVRDAGRAPHALYFWQPVFQGKPYLTQFLRLGLAGKMLADAGPGSGGSAALREELRRGKTLEIGGYALAPELALALDELDGVRQAPPDCPLHWFELVLPATGELAPATTRMADAWRTFGAQVNLHPLHGVAFWATAEIAECQALLAATAAVYTP